VVFWFENWTMDFYNPICFGGNWFESKFLRTVNFCEKVFLRIILFATSIERDRLKIHKKDLLKGRKKFMSFSDCFRLQSRGSLVPVAWDKRLRRNLSRDSSYHSFTEEKWCAVSLQLQFYVSLETTSRHPILDSVHTELWLCGCVREPIKGASLSELSINTIIFKTKLRHFIYQDTKFTCTYFHLIRILRMITQNDIQLYFW